MLRSPAIRAAGAAGATGVTGAAVADASIGTSARSSDGSSRGPSSGSDVRLVVEGLQVNLKSSGADVVADVSFQVEAGEILGLVGESGSGKTTVAHALLGHARRGLEIVAGSVRLDGREILSMSQKQLAAVRGAEISYVPQDPASALNPVIRVGAQLREALQVHPGATTDVDRRIGEVLAEVKLDSAAELLKRYPHQLSGGQQQRVALAMAFACRPKLIVLDEPTTGLDVTTQRHVLDTIRSLCAAYGVGAVYVSHDLAVIGELVQNVVVMYAGRQVEIGTTETIFSAPAHPYSARLLRAVPSPDRAEILEGIEGQPPRPGHRPKGCAFAPRCPLVIDQCRENATDTRHPRPEGTRSSLLQGDRGDNRTADRTARRVVCHRARDRGWVSRRLESLCQVRPCRGGSLGRVRRPPRHHARPRRRIWIGQDHLARLPVGMHSSWTGEIKFQGQDLQRGVHDRPTSMQRAIQYIFQNPYTSLNPRKTVGQLVSQPLEHFSRSSHGAHSSRSTRSRVRTSRTGW